jgi:DtxR family Mn-dependent transcriptional regulator
MTTERTEDYLKVIEKIIERKGYAQVKDVSRELDISSPSVTGMFKKLTKMGYINYEKYGGVTLTPDGEKIAKCTMEKHGVIKDFLLILGLDKDIADQDACKIEHVLAPETFKTLTKFVEFMNMKDKWPNWLDHFNYYCETGEYIDCDPSSKDKCPIHGESHSKQ